MSEHSCRNTQHCVDYGFCQGCNPELAERAHRVLAVLREEFPREQAEEAYRVVVALLQGREIERCTHNRAMHDLHHRTHAPHCPWCNEPESARRAVTRGFVLPGKTS